MLREITGVRQVAGEPLRRWFQDEAMDLFVWLGEANTVVGFQLAYDKSQEERALTWKLRTGYQHARVDDGTRPGRHPGSPLLIADGVFDVIRVSDEFQARAAEIDSAVHAFVSGKLADYERARSVESPAVASGGFRTAWLRLLQKLRSWLGYRDEET